MKARLGGFSKVLPIEEATSVQKTKVNLYLAPEVITNNELSVASDVWSLGVTLYVLGTGRFPFNSMHEILNMPIIWKSEDTRHLSSDFRALVNTLLIKQKEARPKLS